MNTKPNLYIAGVAKAATTVLANYLAQHPEVYFSDIKEPNYFSAQEIKSARLYYDTKPIETESAYLNLFQTASKVSIRGEASVSYFFYQKSAHRIKQFEPKSKVILILRNPIDRAFSHYLMDKRLGFVKASFDEIISSPKEHGQHYAQYIEQGKYCTGIEEFKKVFGENLLILDWKREIKAHLNQIYHFLELEPVPVSEVEANRSLIPKNRLLQQIYASKLIRHGLKKLIPQDYIKTLKNSQFKAQDEVISEKNYKYLEQYYFEDLSKVEALTGFKLKSNIKF